jgi:hypothetical protein
MKTNLLKCVVLTITIYCLFSCTPIPMLNGNKPFVVNEIDELSGGMSEYFGGLDAGYGNSFKGRPSIILPTRLYNIGDTINIKK